MRLLFESFYQLTQSSYKSSPTELGGGGGARKFGKPMVMEYVELPLQIGIAYKMMN